MDLKWPPSGLFITGTGTEVGKTYVASLIAKTLRAQGVRVGVYKPVASGCELDSAGQIVASDALRLWEAADRPETLEAVCPQKFRAPLAPHRAAQAEGKLVDAALLRKGLSFWSSRCEFVLVEGAGGLMSPVTEDDYNADLASEFGYPLIVVAPNRLGVINDTLQTLITASTYRDGLDVAGIVLNNIELGHGDASRSTNRQELELRCVPPVLCEVGWNATSLAAMIDWQTLCKE